MNLNKLRDKAYQCAVAHGWHEEELSNEHFLCLVISELMEAVEADRKERHADVAKFNEWQGNSIPLTEETRLRRFKEDFEAYIKGTVEEELADACIRLLDLAGLRNIDMNDRFIIAYIVSGKKTFTENIYAVLKDIVNYRYSFEGCLNYSIRQIIELSRIKGIEIEWFINQKMKYNELRPYKHGDKSY